MKCPFFILLAWMPVVYLPLSAQEAASTTETATQTPPAELVLSIHFPGGSLAKLLEQVRKDSPGPLNIVDQGDADEIPIPQLRLQAVTVEDLMEILNFMGSSGSADPRFSLNRVTDNTWVVGKPAARSFGAVPPPAPPMDVPAPSSGAISPALPPAAPVPRGLGGAGAFGGGLLSSGGRSVGGGVAAYGSDFADDSKEAAFFSVSRLLKNHTVDDILTTVSTAWEMLKLPGHASEHIRFHEDTKLLIVTGDPATLSLVKSALSALEAEAHTEREQSLMKQVEEAQRLAQQMEMRNAQSKEQVRMSEQMAAQKVDSVKQSLEIDLKRLAEENAELRARIREMESERQQQ